MRGYIYSEIILIFNVLKKSRNVEDIFSMLNISYLFNSYFFIQTFYVEFPFFYVRFPTFNVSFPIVLCVITPLLYKFAKKIFMCHFPI